MAKFCQIWSHCSRSQTLLCPNQLLKRAFVVTHQVLPTLSHSHPFTGPLIQTTTHTLSSVAQSLSLSLSLSHRLAFLPIITYTFSAAQSLCICCLINNKSFIHRNSQLGWRHRCACQLQENEPKCLFTNF